jgi:hypothetical protein
MNHFITISTYSHLYKVQALANSLQQAPAAFLLHVLVTDRPAENAFDNCRFYALADVKHMATAIKIIDKYNHNSDKLRWSLKPVMMKYLLTSVDVDKIIYLDNDLFFYSDYSFLFNLLDEHSFLLTPHYYKRNPGKEQNWLEANFRVGLFNAGFVGAHKKAADSLQWWADCCLYRCEKNAVRGLFDDQKYLDLIPVMEPTALILQHQGCNVAGWNSDLCKRETVNGEVLINGKFPIVFIHFNGMTVRQIVSGADAALAPYYQQYVQALKKCNPAFKEAGIYRPFPITDRIKLAIWQLFTQLGW